MRCTPNQPNVGPTAFARAARTYWLDVFPVARQEIHRLQLQASQIPDGALRRVALDTLRRKWANLEGAAAFAAFLAAPNRHAVARLLVGYQAAYDYADTLMEQPSTATEANGRQLHAALTAILQPAASPQPDYYRHHSCRQDGGYLPRIVTGCRSILTQLPAYPRVAANALQSAQRGVEYQARVSLATKQDHPALIRSAARTQAAGSLRWWETWAACGSSLHTLALLAAAADPATDAAQSRTIDDVYWPWAGALHGLLDGMTDRAEDLRTGQPNLIDLYTSPQQAAARIAYLAAESLRRAANTSTHTLIIAAMIGLYLSDPQGWTPAARPTTEAVLGELGALATPTMLILRTRRIAPPHFKYFNLLRPTNRFRISRHGIAG